MKTVVLEKLRVQKNIQSAGFGRQCKQNLTNTMVSVPTETTTNTEFHTTRIVKKATHTQPIPTLAKNS